MDYRYENSVLNYEIIGEGKPILILHGFGGNIAYMKECMEPVFETQKDYQRIYVDLPGMGKSRFELKYASADEILKVLISFINSHIDGNFLLAGQSYGGYLARGVLSHFHKRVDGLMLLCPVVFPETEDRNVPPSDIKYIDDDFLSGLDAADKDAYLDYAIVINETTYQRFHRAAYTALMEAQQDFLKKLKSHYAYSFDVDRKIKELRYEAPVSLIAARQDICVGYQDLWNLVGDYPRAGFFLVDMAGHNMQTEQPDIFYSLVKNWLQNVEKMKNGR